MSNAADARIGDYVLQRELPARVGERAFAATHVLLPRRARIVLAELGEHAVRLVREACLLEALQHTAVPRVFECGRLADRRPWIATELVDGDPVYEGTQPARPVALLAMLRDVSEVLHHAHHRGVVHGNLSAHAIMQRANGTYVVTEWSGTLVQHAQLDPAGDIYTLGVIAYAALIGDLPTISATRRAPTAPPALTLLIDRMLARDPARRPTAGEVRAEAIGAMLIPELPELPGLDDSSVVAVEVELVDVDESQWSDSPAVPNRRIAWTPPNPFAATQLPDPVMIQPRRRS